MHHSSNDEFHYIGHVIDHFSKYHVLFPLKTKTGHEVTMAQEKHGLAYLGLPRIFHSDNGREFVNSLLNALRNVGGEMFV